MKKFISLLLISTMLLCVFCSCGSTDAGEKVLASVTPKQDKNSYIKPDKKEQTEENQEKLDEYYEKMLELYPDFGAIPRDMLKESISVTSDNIINIRFTFCFGGIATDCVCEFRQNKRFPDGEWSIDEDCFSKYYQYGMDEETLEQIKTYLLASVTEFTDKYALDKEGLSADNLGIHWQTEDEKIYAYCEYIASTTALTTRTFGCGDHAHIFARVLVDISGNKIKLTSLSATGG